ncbi:MAG: aldo/keto reductase [Chloroflexi bacterium]|nr:aldo/keto reductase [Chloroflexota bacterium]
MPTITLGRTGLQVTRLGIGGAYGKEPDMYRQALDCGVNYIDLAREYLRGENEKIVGEALKGRSRQDVIIATKSGKRTAEEMRKELEISLRDLQTDYLDIWHSHAVMTRAELARQMGPGGGLEAQLKAKKEGLVRFIGVTGHDWSVLHEALSTGVFDVVLCWYNCAMREPEGMVFPVAAEQNMGVTLMSVARSTVLYANPGAPFKPDETDFYRYVLTHPAPHVAMMGLRDVDRFRRTVAGLCRKMTLTEPEMRRMEAYGAQFRAQDRLTLPF